jgi:hypothetical protein
LSIAWGCVIIGAHAEDYPAVRQDAVRTCGPTVYTSYPAGAEKDMIRSFLIIVLIGGSSFVCTGIGSPSVFCSGVLPLMFPFALVALCLVLLFYRLGNAQTTNSRGGEPDGFGDFDAGGVAMPLADRSAPDSARYGESPAVKPDRGAACARRLERCGCPEG